MPVVRGRVFLASDGPGHPNVAIVNETAARRLWPQGDAIRQRVAVGNGPADREVVGVVGDTDIGLPGNRGALVVTPIAQRVTASGTLIVRTSGPPQAFIESLRSILKRLNPSVAVMNATTVADEVATLTAPVRLATVIIAMLAGIGLFVAMVGLYATMAYTVKVRTREIGIRIALGASREQTRSLVLRQAAWMLVGGIVPGLCVAFLGAQWLRSLLFGIDPHDPVTFVAVPTALVLVGLLAALLPGLRAARIDPNVALRIQ